MTTMNWTDTLELTLDGIAQGGEGVGRWQGRVVFVSGGLPGERVQVRLRERHESYAHADVIDILEASPDRVPPRILGADYMPWQHIAYPAQLRFKRQILADQLAKIGGLSGDIVEETLPAPRQWAYRSSARFHSDGARVGYHAAESHDIYEIEADPLLQPGLNQALAGLRAALRAHTWAAAPAPFEITMRLSEAYGYTVAALQGRGDLRRLAGRWRAISPTLAGVVVGPRHAAQPVCLGADHLIEELGGIAFHLGPTTFFQVNMASAETLLQLVRAGIAPQSTDRLLDLYCGAGAFSLPLAADVVEVVGIEEYGGAVADARTTAEQSAITNARFETGRVETILESLDEPFDVAVLDPPRRGCHPRALAALLARAPSRIAYIACHPATLARDLKTLVAGGYRVTSVRPIDLFPQTPHIESVSLLVREG